MDTKLSVMRKSIRKKTYNLSQRRKLSKFRGGGLNVCKKIRLENEQPQIHYFVGVLPGESVGQRPSHGLEDRSQMTVEETGVCELTAAGRPSIFLLSTPLCGPTWHFIPMVLLLLLLYAYDIAILIITLIACCYGHLLALGLIFFFVSPFTEVNSFVVVLRADNWVIRAVNKKFRKAPWAKTKAKSAVRFFK